MVNQNNNDDEDLYEVIDYNDLDSEQQAELIFAMLEMESQKEASKETDAPEIKRKSLLTFGEKLFLGTLACLLIVFSIGFCVFKFIYKTNIFSFYNQVQTLNQNLVDENLISYKYTNQDKVSFESKFEENEPTNGAYLFSDKEIGAYISNNIINFGESTDETNNEKPVKFSECEITKLIQIDFFNTFSLESSNQNHLTDMNVVVCVDLTKFIEHGPSNFPINLLRKNLPEQIYISATVGIEMNEDSYSLTYKSISLNNLSVNDSEEFLLSLSKLTKDKNAQKYCLEICGNVAEKIMGSKQDSIFSSLKTKGMLYYSFFTENEIQYFVAFPHRRDETAKITYIDKKGVENNNITQYNAFYNNIELQNLELLGYEFLGWFDGETENSNKIETIVAWKLENFTLYAKWEIIVYTIDYNLRNAVVDGTNPTTYTIESEFEILKPKKNGDTVFNGWTIKYLSSKELVPGYNDPEMNLKIKAGTYGNLILYARFDDERILSIYADDRCLLDLTIYKGESFSEKFVTENLDYSKIGLTGYTITKWCADKNLTKEYDFSTIVTDDTELYVGDLDYIAHDLKFYPYLQEFKTGVENSIIYIDSFEELSAYIEYACFYEINKSVILRLTYTNSSSKCKNELVKAINSQSNSLDVHIKYSYSINNSDISFNFNSDYSEYSKYTMDPNKDYTISQYDNALYLKNENKRKNDFDDFKINNIIKTLDVSTGFQLEYCLEQGFRPIVKSGSNAEKVYNEAKKVLREICNDEMSDFEKTRAIYEWLALNVSYDHKALNYGTGEINSRYYFRNYKSWYAEGALIDKVAVCAGYAKAFIVMARIEGIPIIYVSGNEHAWNRVMIDGKWYGVDATHADSVINSQNGENFEALTYNQFLFSDEEKTAWGYTSLDYIQFSADSNYDYYKNVTYNYNSSAFDLYISSLSEIDEIVNFVINNAKNCNYNKFSFELKAKQSINDSLIYNRVTRKFHNYVTYSQTSCGDGTSVYTFFVRG